MAQLPSDFLLGAATSSYQIEGAVQADGRGESIWDRFSHLPGKTVFGQTGDTATDHYHRYQEDLNLMQQLGLDSYRFSIAWPRIIPEGRGLVNQQGLDFYKRLVDGLLERGIVPMATLYHWDLPQELQDQGGWLNRQTAEAFGEYADVIFRSLGDVIPFFITLNEPWCSAVLGHGTGAHAPGLTDYGSAAVAGHHLLLAHARGVQAFRASALPTSQIGVTNVLTFTQPASALDADVKATRRLDAFLNRWFLDPLFLSRYPFELVEFGVRDPLVQPGDLEQISAKIDFLGVNYYQRAVIRANPTDSVLGGEVLAPAGEVTAMGWGVYPEGLEGVLAQLASDYPSVPIYITESGAAFNDVLEKGRIRDGKRIEYHESHIASALSARARGVDVRGYFAWSLMDNFEWAEGYTKRFGLIFVNYETQERVWKDSANWYREVLRTRELTSSKATDGATE